MTKDKIIEELTELLEKQRQDLNNGSDYQDAIIILDFLERQGYVLFSSDELINLNECIVEYNPKTGLTLDNYKNQADGVIDGDSQESF